MNTDDADWYSAHFIERANGDFALAYQYACEALARGTDEIARLSIEMGRQRQTVSAGYIRNGFTPIRPPKRPVAAIDIPPPEAQHD